MPRSKRQSSLPAAIPSPVKYIHPVDLLVDRLEVMTPYVSQLVEISLANNKLSYKSHDGVGSLTTELRPDAYCDKLYEMYASPSLRSLDRAIPATLGIGRWLRWGMADRAGTFETELRGALQYLRRWAFHFPGLALYPNLKERLVEWEVNVSRVGEMLYELQSVATEKEPAEWIHSLHDALKASTLVKTILNEVYSAAVANSVQLPMQEKAAREAICAFRDILKTIGPRFVFLLDDDEYAEYFAEHLPTRLFNRIEELSQWSERRCNPSDVDPIKLEKPWGTPVSHHLESFEKAIGYLLGQKTPDAEQGVAVRKKRRQRFAKADHADFVRAREDTIAEIIRGIAREGGIVTSDAISQKSKGSDGKAIPEGTIRHSKSWKNRNEIASQARRDTSYMEKYRGHESYSSDNKPFDETESI